MKQKLIFVTEALWIGGIESALVNLLNALDYEKYEVTCLVLRASLEMAPRITPKCRLLVADREGIHSFKEAYRYSRLYHLTEESTSPSRLHRSLMWTVLAVKWVENRLYIRYLRRQLREEAFDTCVIYSDTAAETAVRAVNAKRFLLFYHHGAMRRVYHDGMGYRKAETIITVSEGTADMLKAFRPRYAHKVKSIPNLIDIPRVLEMAKASPEYRFPAEGFHVVTCGRLSEAKGIDLAIKACRILLDRGHEDLHWWVLGGGPEEGKLGSLIFKNNLEDRFHLLGMQENPYPFMAAADLYVQPSRFESYGMSIAEAVCLGKAVVSTETDGAKAFINHGENGLLCAAEPEAIAHGVEYLRTHGEAVKKYVEYGKKNGLEEENAANLEALHRLFAGE